jgi:hypothetical protein
MDNNNNNNNNISINKKDENIWRFGQVSKTNFGFRLIHFLLNKCTLCNHYMTKKWLNGTKLKKTPIKWKAITARLFVNL